MKERIRQIMEQAGLSQQDFAVKLGVSPASMSSIFTGRTKPTNNHVMAVHRTFPNVNVNWLIFGEGEMYVDSTAMADAEAGDEPAFDFEVDAEEGKTTGGTDGQMMSSMFSEESFSVPPSGRKEVVAAAVQMNHPAVLRPERRSSSGREPVSHENVKIIDKQARKIKEIRVFFDDGTYEAFVPSSK